MTTLKNSEEIVIRFHEVDSMGVVWHGNYINYFEIGRESFGKEFGLTYMQVYDEGFLVPIVRISCDFKRPIFYEDCILIETEFCNSPAAKIIFNYTIKNTDSGIIYATGYSEQVFLTYDRKLHLTNPSFFATWKKRHGIEE